MKAASQSPELTAGRRHTARSPRRGDVTEAAVLDTAWSLLATRTLSQITIEEIATGAGISRPTFYFYFGSKEEMAHALAHRVADEIRLTAAGFFQTSDEPPRSSIREGVAAYMNRWQEQGAVLRSMASLGETDEALRVFWQEVTNDLLDELAVGIDEEREAGRMLPAPPSSGNIVRALLAMLWRSGYELSLYPRTGDDREQLIDTLTTVILRTLYGADDPA